ncbi:MAG: PAS domain-containing protein [Gemmatimonadaceae bacterium]
MSHSIQRPLAASSAPPDAELALFSDLDEAVIRLDRAGRLDYANEAARRLLGIASSTLDRLPLLATAIPWLATALWPAVATGGAAVVEVHDARHRRWLSCRVHPLRSGTAVLIEDITLRQLAELARQRVLLQATAGASASDIVHEFNNAIMALAGNVELVEAELDSIPELQESLADVRGAAERAMVLARQLVECVQLHTAVAPTRRAAEPRPPRQRPRTTRS